MQNYWFHYFSPWKPRFNPKPSCKRIFFLFCFVAHYTVVYQVAYPHKSLKIIQSVNGILGPPRHQSRILRCPSGVQYQKSQAVRSPGAKSSSKLSTSCRFCRFFCLIGKKQMAIRIQSSQAAVLSLHKFGCSDSSLVSAVRFPNVRIEWCPKSCGSHSWCHGMSNKSPVTRPATYQNNKNNTIQKTVRNWNEFLMKLG